MVFDLKHNKDYLSHSGKSGQRSNHKYIARVPSGNGYRYFYTTEELAAYNKANKKDKALSNFNGSNQKSFVTGMKRKANSKQDINANRIYAIKAEDRPIYSPEEIARTKKDINKISKKDKKTGNALKKHVKNVEGVSLTQRRNHKGETGVKITYKDGSTEYAYNKKQVNETKLGKSVDKANKVLNAYEKRQKQIAAQRKKRSKKK